MPASLEWDGWAPETLSTGKEQPLVADLLGSEETLKKVLRLMVKGIDAPLLARMEKKSDEGSILCQLGDTTTS